MKFEAIISNTEYYYSENYVEKNIYLPATKEEIENIYVELGIDKSQNIIFVDEVRFPFEHLNYLFCGYFNLESINELTIKLSNFTPEQFNILRAIDEIEGIEYLDELEDIVEHIDDYELLPDIRSDEDLSDYFMENIDVESLRAYVNSHQLGHDIRATLNAGHSKYGCLVDNRH